MKKPDKDYVASYLKEKRTEYSKRDEVDDRMYKLYHGDYAPELPANVKADPIQTGYATQFIDRVMGIFTHEKPTVSMTPTGIGDEAIKHTSKVEEFLNALFPAMQGEAQEPTWHHVTQDTLLYGRGISIMPPAYGIYWKDYPGQDEDEDDRDYNKRTEEWKKASRLPLAWRHVPVLKAYPDWDDYGLAEIATQEQRTLRQLTNQYDEKANWLKKRFGDDLSTKLTLIKYANRDWLEYFVDGKDASGTPELLRRIEHKCGLVPYVYIKGKCSSSTRPEHATKSLLYHMENLILYLEKLLIQKGTAIRIWCWPQLVRKRRMDAPLGDDSNPLNKTDLDLNPGQTIEILEGEEVSFLVWTGNAPDIDEQIATIQRYIDRMGLASVMYGTTASDASSGYAINTLIQAAQSLFGPIAEHLADGYRDLGKLALKHVELLGQTLYVYKRPGGKGWVSLAPDDIKGYYYMEGLVEATLPQELPVNAQIARQLTEGDNPLMDMYTARTKLLKDKYPDKTAARIRLEKWQQRPEIEGYLTMEAIKMAGVKIDQIEAGEAQMQGPLAPGLAGLLGQPGLAGPGMAAPGGAMGQATVPMQPGLGMPAMATPQQPGPQAQVNSAERAIAGAVGGRRAGAARQPGGPRGGRGAVP